MGSSTTIIFGGTTALFPAMEPAFSSPTSMDPPDPWLPKQGGLAGLLLEPLIFCWD